MASQPRKRTAAHESIEPDVVDPRDEEIVVPISGESATPARRPGRPRHGPAVARHLPRDEEILQIAAEVFLKNGEAGTKLDEIARKAGIAKGSLYHYFESKEQIYERLIRGVVQRLDEEQSSSPAGSPTERLAAYVRHRARVAAENPVECAIITRHLSTMDGDIGEWVRNHRRRELQYLRQILLAGQRDGLFRPCNVETLATFIFSAINGLADWFRPGGHYSAEEITEDLVDYVVSSAGVPWTEARSAS